MARMLLLVILMLSGLNVQAHLIIKDAWVREAPPRSRTLAMFLQVTNHGDQPEVINGASSEQFSKVELHETSFDKGMMRMKHIPELTMKPDQVLDFKPGGMHIMLMNPVKIFKAGDQVDIKLHMKNGKKKAVRALVLSSPPVSAGSATQEHHQH